MENIRFCTDESVNYLLNYSKMMIDEIANKKNCPNDFKEYQYLVFAGMLSYYGFEHLDAIYKAFENTGFIGDNNIQFSDSPVKKAMAYCQAEFVLTDSKINVNRNIHCLNDNCGSIDFLESITHEVNHCINSVMSSICFRNRLPVYRVGVNINSLDGFFNEAEILEETFNNLQTEEILAHIRSFLNYSIDDLQIKNVLDQFRNPSFNWNVVGYDILLADVRPLYFNPNFYYLLKENRISGDIKEIRRNFDDKAGNGSFLELSKVLDCIWKEEVFEQKNKVYKIVSRYNR